MTVPNKIQSILSPNSVKELEKPEIFFIKNIIQTVIAECEIVNEEQKKLIEVDLKDDFFVQADQCLVSFLFGNLIKKFLNSNFKRITVCLDKARRLVHFKIFGDFLNGNRIDIDFSFYQIAMNYLQGNIRAKFIADKELEFCFNFLVC